MLIKYYFNRVLKIIHLKSRFPPNFQIDKFRSSILMHLKEKKLILVWLDHRHIWFKICFTFALPATHAYYT